MSDNWIETKREADKLVASILAIPSRLFNKSTGSRVFTTILAMGSSYLIATQSGLEGNALVAATLAPVFGSGVLVYAKTKQHSDEIKAASNEAIVSAQVTGTAKSIVTPTSAKKPVTPIVVKWKEPFNVATEKLVVGDPYTSWENAQDWLVRVELDEYKPEVRWDFGLQIYAENIRRWNMAWDYMFELAKAKEKPRLLTYPDDFIYDWLKPEVEKELENLIPASCPRLGYQVGNIRTLVAERVKLFELGDALSALEGKEVDWYNTNTLNDIRRKGLASV